MGIPAQYIQPARIAAMTCRLPARRRVIEASRDATFASRRRTRAAGERQWRTALPMRARPGTCRATVRDATAICASSRGRVTIWLSRRAPRVRRRPTGRSRFAEPPAVNGEIAEEEHEATQNEDLVYEPVGGPDGPLGAAQEEHEFGDDDDDLDHGDGERQRVRVAPPVEQRPCKPEMDDPPEVPVDVLADRCTIAHGHGNRKGELDDERPGRQHDQQMR